MRSHRRPPWRALILVILCIAQHAAAQLVDSEHEALKDFMASVDAGSPRPLKTVCGWRHKDSDPCCTRCEGGNTWLGVVCSGSGCNATTLIHIIGLSINNLGLVGKPDHLDKLPYLKSLELANNSFINWPTIGKHACNLEKLVLSRNRLGEVDPFLETCTQLTYLDISYNNILGDLSFAENLTELTYLDVSGNRFHQNIPESLGYAHLNTLYILSNQLTGSIPASFINLQDLQIFYAYDNQLGGSIADDLFSQMPHLYDLELGNNNINGPIPSSLCSCPAFTTLDLSANYFDATIPVCLGQLTQLNYLDLSNNNLRGSIPESLGGLNLLQDLYLDANYLEGEIPDSITELSALQQIILSACALRGVLPSNLTLMTNLTMLDVSFNNISGSIPEDIGSLYNLNTLRLSANSFTGTMPASFANLTSLVSLDLSINRFDGAFPPEWQPYSTALTHVGLYGNNWTLSGKSGKLTDHIPKFFALVENKETQECEYLGDLAYFDISGYSLNPFSIDVLLQSTIANFHDLWESCDKPPLISLETVHVSNTSANVFSSFVFELLPNLVLLDLSYNNLQGQLPADVPIPPYLSLFDVSNNNMTGGMPTNFAPALAFALKRVSLKGNKHMVAMPKALTQTNARVIPEFLAANYVTVQDNATAHYTCPSLTNARTSAAFIEVDPEFYGFILCTCAPNYYGDPQHGCKTVASLCLGSHTQCVRTSLESHVNYFGITAGYYPSPVPTDFTSGVLSNITTLLPCGTLNNPKSSPCNGSSRCEVARFDNSGLVCNITSWCVPGYEGRMCSECADGYYVDLHACKACPVGHTYLLWAVPAGAGLLALLTAVARCVMDADALEADDNMRAPSKTRAVIAMLALCMSQLGALVILAASNLVAPWELEVLAILFVLSLVLLVSQRASSVPAAQRPLNTYSIERVTSADVVPLINGLFKSAVIYLQSLAVVAGPTLDTVLTWVPDINISIHFGGLECVSPTFTPDIRLLLVLLVPVGLGLMALIAFSIRYAILFKKIQPWRGPTTAKKFRRAVRDVGNQCGNAVLFLFNLLYFEMCSRVLELFNCQVDPTRDQPETVYWNEVYPYLRCYSTSWWSQAVIGIVFFLVYGAVIVWLLAKMYRLRDRLEENNVKSLYGFFYQAYRRKSWWYDGLVLTRRILIALFMAILPDYSPYQVLALVIVLTVALILQVRIRPLRHRPGNFMEIVSIMAILLSFTITSAENGNSPRISDMIVGLNGAVILLYIIVIVAPLLPLLNRQRCARCSPCGGRCTYLWEWLTYIEDADNYNERVHGRSDARLRINTDSGAPKPNFETSPLLSTPSGSSVGPHHHGSIDTPTDVVAPPPPAGNSLQ